MHLDTGLMWVDVEDDFSRARRRHVLAQVAGWLRGQRYATRIVSLDEVIAVLGWRGERYLGLRTIQLDAVTGTVDSRHDFDRKFRPASSRVRQRWERLDLAQRRGAAIPPIDVYLVGDMYFVKDGHHRVSVATATRQKALDAYVTEVHTRVPAAGISLRGLQVRMAASAAVDALPPQPGQTQKLRAPSAPPPGASALPASVHRVTAHDLLPATLTGPSGFASAASCSSPVLCRSENRSLR